MSLLSSVDLYWKSQPLVEYSKYLHTCMILDDLQQEEGYLFQGGVTSFMIGYSCLELPSSSRRYYKGHTKNYFSAICSPWGSTPWSWGALIGKGWERIYINTFKSALAMSNWDSQWTLCKIHFNQFFLLLSKGKCPCTNPCVWGTMMLKDMKCKASFIF